MPLIDFLESLERDRRFGSQIAEHRFIPPLEPKYTRLDVNERLKDVLRTQGVKLFWRPPEGGDRPD